MIIIYTKPDCGYCVKAKTLMNEKGYKYITQEIGKDLTREEFISLFPTQKTLPLILSADKKIGGFTELKEFIG